MDDDEIAAGWYAQLRVICAIIASDPSDGMRCYPKMVCHLDEYSIDLETAIERVKSYGFPDGYPKTDLEVLEHHLGELKQEDFDTSRNPKDVFRESQRWGDLQLKCASACNDMGVDIGLVKRWADESHHMTGMYSVE